MVITTESEYDRLRATVKELMSRDEDDLSAVEVKLLDLLVTLIDRYEETHYAIERGTAHEILHHLMEARSLTHKDVGKLFGSKGVARKSQRQAGDQQDSRTSSGRLLPRLCRSVHWLELDPPPRELALSEIHFRNNFKFASHPLGRGDGEGDFLCGLKRLPVPFLLSQSGNRGNELSEFVDWSMDGGCCGPWGVMTV